MTPPATDRLLGCLALAPPAVALSAVPALQFPHSRWLCLTLAAPVVVWGAWPFHRAAAAALRHGRATTDTLVSVGTLAALGWSVAALLRGAPDAVLLGVAAAVTAVALLARWAAGRVPVPAGPADRVAAVAVPVAGALAVATLGFWLGAGAAPGAALGAAVSVLVVGCPGAAALAVPAALLAAHRRAARAGVGIGGAAGPLTAARLDTVVLRSGDLTAGAPALHTTHVDEGVLHDDVLRLAGAVAAEVDDPVARAVAAAARGRFGALPAAAEFDAYAGLGARGIVAEVVGDTVVAHAVLVGRAELLAEHDIALPASLTAARDATEAAGHAAVAVAWDGIARGVLEVADPVPTAHVAAVADLRALGLTPVLVTGRPPGTARGIAAQAGIDPADVVADAPPEHTAAVVRALRAAGGRVAVLGTADVAARVAADLAVAPGPDPGGPVDLRAARGGLPAATDAVTLARHAGRTISGNLCWGYAGSAAALPPAAAGLLHPTIALAATLAGVVLVAAHSALPVRLRGSAAPPGPDRSIGDAARSQRAEPATAR